jgi:hypothetical protein
MEPGLGLFNGFFALKSLRAVLQNYLVYKLSTVNAIEIGIDFAPLPEFISEHEPTTSGTFHDLVPFPS